MHEMIEINEKEKENENAKIKVVSPFVIDEVIPALHSHTSSLLTFLSRNCSFRKYGSYRENHHTNNQYGNRVNDTYDRNLVFTGD